MSSDPDNTTMEKEAQSESQEQDPDTEELLDTILGDPRKKAALLLRIGLDEQQTREPATEGEKADVDRHLTTSGKSTGGWSYPPAPFWPYPFPQMPFPGYSGYPDLGYQRQFWQEASDLPGPSGLSTERPSTSGSRNLKRPIETQGDEDVVDLLDESEALEMIEFDPSVEPSDTWQPPASISNFLEKHFNRSLSEDEKEAIMKDFPKPNCKVLSAPKLDDQVKDQLKKKGKDPHFGAEKSLFKLQEQLLDVAGPLTCLWADLLNKEANVTAEDTLLLIQRAIVLLGSASHSITLERRKIAWSRINPKLKSLASEEYGERESNLFGPGFLEKASKRLEVEKTLDKVSNQGKSSQQAHKKARFENDKSDLRSFLAKGASVVYGNSRIQRQSQPYNAYTRFRNRRYYQGSTNARTSQSQAPRNSTSGPNEKNKQ